MAKGYPDFFGFSIFPQFGTFNNEVINSNIAAGITDSIWEINDKGRIYSGYFEFSTDDPANIFPTLNVDGNSISYLTPTTMLTRGVSEAYDLPLLLAEYNLETPNFLIVVQTDITFALSCSLEIQNATAGLVTFSGNLCWAQVV